MMMTTDQILTLIGLVLSGSIALVGTTFAIIKYVNSQVVAIKAETATEIKRIEVEIKEIDERRSSNNRDLHIKLDEGTRSLDIKFNGVRDTIDRIKDQMVRREDLNGHIERLERAIEGLTTTVNLMRDQFVQYVVKNGGG